MKNIAKKIAMILVIVLIVNCFTGCAEWAGAILKAAAPYLIGALVVCGVIVLIITIASVTSTAVNDNKDLGPKDSSPIQILNDTSNSTVNSLSKEEIESLTKAFYSLPDKELSLFINRLTSMSEKESISLMNSINSFSAQELSAIVETVNSMSKTEKITTIETVNSMPNNASMTYFVKNIEVDISGEKASLGQRVNY